MSAFLLLLALSGTIRVSVEGEASEVVAYHRGEPVGRAAVEDGVAVLRDLPHDAVDIVALGENTRSELVRRVRPAEDGQGSEGRQGFDARLRALPAHRVTIRTEEGAHAHVGGVRFPADRVLLLPGLHRVVVDHDRLVSSAARLLRVDRDLTLDVSLDAGLVVTGAVFDHEGNKLQGAAVEVFTDGYAANRTATTDANGAYGVSGFRGNVVTLRVRAPGHATRRVRVTFDPGSERSRQAVHLVRGSTIRLPIAGGPGEVRATLLPVWFERALEEPRLRVNDEPSRATGREAVEFQGLTPGSRYRILVECPGFLPATTAEFEAGATDRLAELRLEAGGTLRGTLKGPEVPAAWDPVVVARGAFGDRTSRLDRNGSFAFEGMPAGKVVLLLRDLDERGQLFELKPQENREVVLPYVVPDAKRALEGSVLGADRKPLAGVLVRNGWRSARTDAKGEFRLPQMPLGRDRFDLQFEPTPSSTAFREVPHLPRVERRAKFGIRVGAQLERSGSLTIDWADARLARATLYLSGTSGNEMLWRIPRGAKDITVDEIPVGSYVVEVGAPGYLGTGGALAKVSGAPGERVDVQLLRGRTVSGRVARRRGVFRTGKPPQLIDAPITSGTVSLYELAGRFALATAPIAEDGTFLLEGLPAAPVLLVAGAPGMPVGTLRVDLTKRGQEHLVIPLFDPLRGGVKVTGEGGLPVPRANVSIQTTYGLNLRDLTSRGRFLGTVADDVDRADVVNLYTLTRKKDGAVLYEQFAPGNYEFHVTAPGYKPGVVRMRAREPWTVAHIGTIVPGLDPTAIVPLRLSPVPVAPREEKSTQEKSSREKSSSD